MRSRSAVLGLALSLVACKNVTFPVGGTVAGLAGSGLSLQLNGGELLAVAADGAFTFLKPVQGGAAYAVTVASQPTGPAQTCTVGAGAGTANAAVTDIAVTCATNTHVIGGTVAGLAGSGLVLQDNGGDDLRVAASGAFHFAGRIASGKGFAVSIKQQPDSPTQTCAVAGGAGTIADADIASVSVTCTTNRYSLGGTVRGLVGAPLVLHDSTGDDVSIPGNGSFSFPTLIASGTQYTVSVSKQPLGPSQTCTVAAGTGTIAAGNVDTVAVTCLTNSFAVGGTVTGLLGAGLVLQDNLADNLGVAADGPFAFATAVGSGAGYAVSILSQPTSPSQTCVVAAGAGNVSDGPVTSVNVTCTTNTYFVGGKVTGLRGSGLTLTNNASESLPIGADGSFRFAVPVASGSGFAVAASAQPLTPSQTCVVAGGSGQVGGADVTSVVVTCTTNSFLVGGAVSGLSGRGLTLLDNGGDARAIGGNGSFSFTTPVASGAGYAVTISAQPANPWQTCAVSQGAGTVGNGDVNTVGVACTTNSYPVKVSVSGLSGSGLVLQDNGGDNLSIASNGVATFAAQVRSGDPYNVTVLAQPASPAQTCTVTAPSGAMPNGVTLAVACTTNTYSIGGKVTGLTTTGLVLQDNGGDDLPISGNGPFAFATRVASGAAYAVTVKTQPLQFYCFVTKGAGTVAASAVADVAVQCGVATTCLAIKQANPGSASGTYTITPDGSTAVPAYCDMATDGGGWTLLAWTGSTSVKPYGVPYPGNVYCPAFNCARGSGIPASVLPSLYNRSREFGSAASATTTASFNPMAQYTYVGKTTYPSLAGLHQNQSGTTSCSSSPAFAQGTFTNIAGMPSSNGLVAYLNQDLVAIPTGYGDYTTENGSYIWNVGAPNAYCSQNGSAPGTYMGTWTSCNYPGNGSCVSGAFSVWVR